MKGLMIGDQPIQFGLKDIQVGETSYAMTKELLALIFIKSPDKNFITSIDYDAYTL